MATVAEPAIVDRRPRWAAPVGVIVGALLWELVSKAIALPFVPPLESIFSAASRLLLSGEIADGLFASSGTLAVGYGLAVVIGVPTGLALARQRSLAAVLTPYFDALLAVPSLLLVPVFFGLFGLGIATELAVVVCYSLAVIVEATRTGVSTLDPGFVEMATSFGASERQIYRRVLMPGALPAVMTALRLGLARAVRALINTEMLVGSAGLGTLLRQYGTRFDAASTYGILLVLVAIVLLAHQAVHLADRRLNRWLATSS